MIFAIASFIASLFGWDISKVQRWLLLAVTVIIGIAILALGLWIKSCVGKRHAKLNEKQIQAAQTAIAKQDREQMTRVLVESDVAEKQINDNTANAHTETVNAIEAAKKAYADKTNQELADELNRRAREQ